MTTNPISGSSNPSDKLLFKSKQKKQRKRTKAISNAEKIKSYQDLNVGDYIQ
jgi:transcription-repair coupling factor (superfamily II helicase)